MRMIRMMAEEIRGRAERIQAMLKDSGAKIEIIEGLSVAGGGSTPEQSLPTWLLGISGDPSKLDRKLRAGDPQLSRGSRTIVWC